MLDMGQLTFFQGEATIICNLLIFIYIYNNVHLSRDQLERASYLLGIYTNLRILFIDSTQAMSWIDRANDLPPFNGTTPREHIMEGSLVRLAEVRRFLDEYVY